MTDSANHEHDRRQSFRIDMEEELIDLFWCDEQGKQQQQQIICLDFSKGGVRVECQHEIALNTEVTVVFNAAHPQCQKLPTKVLRCHKTHNNNFQIALKLIHK